MNEAAIKQVVLDICEVMKALPATGAQATTASATEGVYHSHMPMDQETVEETLSHLRLQVKYLLFDLEATRRENRYLRQMLDSRRRQENTDEGEK